MSEIKLVYDSNEISTIVSLIQESNDLIQNDICSSIESDLSLLRELDFFTSGIEEIKKEANKIALLNSNLISLIKSHDDEISMMDNKHNSLFSKDSDDSSISIYSGEQITIDDIILEDVKDGKKVITKFINEVIPSFSFEEKVTFLKKILNDSDNLSLLTNKNESDILIYELKDKIDSSYFIELSKLTKEEEEEIQKIFFEFIVDNDTNIFDEIGEDSFLSGLQYFKEIASKNDTTVTNIIFDKDKNEMFMDIINDIYNSNQIDVLTSDEITSFKKYIDEIASKNNMSIEELLKDSTNSSLIKGGLYNEN